MDEVSCLSDSQLAAKLKSLGLPSGPITKGTRRLFEKVLRKRLFGAEQSPLADESLEERPASDRHEEIKEAQVDTKTNAELPNNDQVDHGSTHFGTYYGIHHLPKDVENDKDTDKESLVFLTLNEALREMKTLKSARLKSFNSRDEAQRFSQDCGFESTEIKIQPANQEPSIPFKSPTPQQLVVFRRYIEKGNLESAHYCMFENPRYLVSSGETPVILQEGSRYNAMHVAAKANEVQMCHLIISTLNDENFWNLMFPNQEDRELCSRRGERMLDYYANSPDKGAGDTPLHIACKFGYTEVVRFLVSLPYLESDKQNLSGETPVQVVCSRCSQKDERQKIILDLLSPKMYVPLLRTVDDTASPILSPPVTTLSNSCIRSLNTVTSSSKLDSKAEVRAYAGPMNPDKAHVFVKEWKSPKKTKFMNDFEKGKEREGRKLAKSHGVPWVEYWSFLGSFADFTSKSGLQKLEKYFEHKLETQKAMDIDIYATPSRKGNPNSFHLQPQKIDDLNELDSDTKVIPVEASSRENTTADKESSNSLGNYNECVKSLIKDFNEDLFIDERTNDMKVQPEEKRLLPSSKQSDEIVPNWTSRKHEESASAISSSVGLLQEQTDETAHNLTSKKHEENALVTSTSNGMFQAQADEIVPNLTSRAHEDNASATNTSVSSLQAQGTIDEIPAEQNCKSHRASDTQMNDIAAQLDGLTLTDEKVDQETCNGGEMTVGDRSKNMVGTSMKETSQDKLAWRDLQPPKAFRLNDMTSSVFISGSFPCKSDFDVFRALEGVSINPSDFPMIHMWMRRVSSYSKDERNRWPSPCSPRFRSYLAKKAPLWTF